MKTFVQKLTEEDEADDTGPNQLSFTNIGFTNIADFKIDKIKLKNVLSLDNQSTVDFVCNPVFFKNTRQVSNFMTVIGNGGKLSTNKKANLEGYGQVWFNERAIPNILSLKNILQKKGFRVSYGNVGNKGFTIRKPNGKDI